jgi:hypothetical protein
LRADIWRVASTSVRGHCSDTQTDRSTACLRRLVAVAAKDLPSSRALARTGALRAGIADAVPDPSARKLQPDLGANSSTGRTPARWRLVTGDAMPIYRVKSTFHWRGPNCCVSICLIDEQMLTPTVWENPFGCMRILVVGSKRTARSAYAAGSRSRKSQKQPDKRFYPF